MRSKWLDLVLALIVSFTVLLRATTYQPITEVFGMKVPTWIYLIVLVFFAVVMFASFWRKHRAGM
ncbi:MAG: hypothetical protein Q4F57_02020 [Weeksellaceae bacterium]|nr:hypothetical protein [Weeksellaceae bacterium]